jgi:hypothetical protein
VDRRGGRTFAYTTVSAYRPVRDVSPYVVSIARRAGARDRCAAEFVRVAIEAAAVATAPVGVAG